MIGVLLGLPGSWADDEHEPSDHYTTKIGGLPDWPPSHEEALKPDLLECRACGSRLSLVAQIYAPISTESSKIEERTVYVFGCLMPQCGTTELSWRAFRFQKASNEKELATILPREVEAEPVASSPVSISKTNWWDGRNSEDDDDDIDLESLGKALSEAGAIASNSKKQNKPNSNSGQEKKVKPSTSKSQTRTVDGDTPVVPCFYVYTKEEPSSKDAASLSLNYASLSFRDRPSDNDDERGNEEAWEEEKYEYDKAFYADRTYLKFKKRLDANPEQCFRYSYGGKLLVATQDVGVPEKCGLCGSPRHYEMQFMPPLIYFLQEEANDCLKQALDNWDWMTLIVHTCSKSCSNSVNEDKAIRDGWIVAEEAVTVQYEKPMKLDQVSYFS